MMLCLFYCAARFTSEGGRIGAGSKAAVRVGFNAAHISLINNGKHNLNPFNGHN